MKPVYSMFKVPLLSLNLVLMLRHSKFIPASHSNQAPIHICTIYGSISFRCMRFRGKVSKRIAVISRKALNLSIFWMRSARKRLFTKVCVDTLWIPNLIIWIFKLGKFQDQDPSSFARSTLCWLVSGLIANYRVRSLSSDGMYITYNTRFL